MPLTLLNIVGSAGIKTEFDNGLARYTGAIYLRSPESLPAFRQGRHSSAQGAALRTRRRQFGKPCKGRSFRPSFTAWSRENLVN